MKTLAVIAASCLLAAAALANLAGCRFASLESPDGWRATYGNVGFDTKAQRIGVRTPGGVEVEVEGLDSQSQAFTAGANAAASILTRTAPPTTVNVEK